MCVSTYFGGSEEDAIRLFPEMPIEWTRRKGHKSNQEIPFLQEQNRFFLLFSLFICLVLVCYGEGGETMEWVALRDGECLSVKIFKTQLDNILNSLL